jgi:aminopeptidase
MTKKDFRNLGFNDSPEHTDIVATTNRVVTAIFKDGSKRVIYKDGEFNI